MSYNDMPKMEELYNADPIPSTSSGIQFGNPIVFAPSDNVDGQGDLAAFSEDQLNNIDYVVAAAAPEEDTGFFEIRSDNQAGFPMASGQFSDIKIMYETPEGKINGFPAHRVILAQNSPYFAALLDEDSPFPTVNFHIAGKMIDENVFKAVMELVYTGRVKVPKAKKEEFDEIHKLFQIGESPKPVLATAAPEPPKIASRNVVKTPRTPKVKATPKVKPLKLKIPKEFSGTPTPSKKVKVEPGQEQDGDQPAGEPLTKEQLSEVSNYAVLQGEEGSFCLVCDSKFTQMTNAKTHFKQKHGFVGADADSLHCHNCGITGSTLELVQHYRTSELCGNVPDDKSNKDLLAEAAQNIVKTEDKKFMCLKCNGTFTQMTNAKTHYKQKHDEADLPEFCVLCGHQDKKMPQMDNHLKNHHHGLRRRDITNLLKKFIGA